MRFWRRQGATSSNKVEWQLSHLHFSHSPPVPHVAQVTIYVDTPYKPDDYGNLANSTSVKSVVSSKRHASEIEASDEHDYDNHLLCSAWIRYGLTDVIKFFQQHNLKKTLTFFRLSYTGPAVEVLSHPDPAMLVEAAREHLLDYRGTA
jgi:hypothetical protein